MEPRLGADLGSVRIHTDAPAHALTERHDARALTAGRDIYFGRGEADFSSGEGRRLLAHELTHVVQQRSGASRTAGPSSSDDAYERHADHVASRIAEGHSAQELTAHPPSGAPVPSVQLQSRRRAGRRPQPPARPADLDAFLDNARTSPAALMSVLQQYPDLAPGVGQRLLARLHVPESHARAATLLQPYLHAHPEMRADVEAAVRADTVSLARDAEQSFGQMWDNYQQAAYAQAMADWLDAEIQAASRRGRAPTSTTFRATDVAALRQSLTAVQAALSRYRGQDATYLTGARGALSTLMERSQPVRYVQELVLTRMAHRVDRGIGRSHRERIETARNAAALFPTAALAARATDYRTRVQENAHAHREAVARHQQAQQTALPNPASAHTRAERRQVRTRRAAIERERRQSAHDIGETERREHQFQSDLSRDQALRDRVAILESPAQRTQAEQQVAGAMQGLQEHMGGVLPQDAAESGSFQRLLTDEDRRWIQQRALRLIETGFPGFSLEEPIIEMLLRQRMAMVVDRRATGIAADVSVGTYASHGWGQFDVMAPIGAEVRAAAPGYLDLTHVLGGAPGQRRLFERVDSTVSFINPVDPTTAADRDVLEKLSYGFFGRSWHGEEMDAFIQNGGPPPAQPGHPAASHARSPSLSRVHSAFRESTIEGSERTEGTQTRLSALQQHLRAAAERRLAAPPEPGTQPEHRTLDGAEQDVLLHDAGLIREYLAVLHYLRFDLGLDYGRSGPMANVIHRFRELDGSHEIWVMVSYIHLRARYVRQGQSVTIGPEGTLIGRAGAAGNAVHSAPHVHMSIGVYTEDPRRHSPRNPVSPIDYLQPLDFFPMLRHTTGAGRTEPRSPAPSAQQEAQ